MRKELNKDILEMLENIKVMREVNPEFGYAGKAGWIDEDDDISNWCED